VFCTLYCCLYDESRRQTLGQVLCSDDAENSDGGGGAVWKTSPLCAGFKLLRLACCGYGNTLCSFPINT
jgi:hypothetical protein